MESLKNRLYRFLRWSEKYTRTDMVYLASSTFWIQASNWLVSIASFALYVIFANTLSKDVYGTYQYLLSVGTIVAAFTMTGMGRAVTRAVARGFEGGYRESIRTQLLWGIVPLVGSIVVGVYYLAHGNITLGYGLFLLGIFTPLSATYNTYGAYLSAKKDFKRGFYYSLFFDVPYYASMVLVVFSFPAALALLGANLISHAVGYYAAHRKTLSLYKPNNTRDSDLTRYGTHLSIMKFLSSAITKFDDLLVFHFLGAIPLALYSFATAVPDRLGIFSSIAAAAFPKYAAKSHTEVRASLGRKTFISILTALAIAGVYALLSHAFFALFFPQYLDAVEYSQVYAFIIALSFSPIFVTALTAHGRTKALYVFNVIAPLLMIAFEVGGIIGWGLWGLVFGKLIATLLGSALAAVLFLLAREPAEPADTIERLLSEESGKSGKA